MEIAIAQLNPIIGDLAGNSAQILVAAQQFQTQIQAQISDQNQTQTAELSLLITPELSICGYPPRDLLMHDGFIQEMALALKFLAKSLPPKIAVLVGTVEANAQADIAGGKPLFNSAALLYDGQIQAVFHKRLLPTYDVFDEDRYFEVGNQPNFFILNNSLRVGVTICEDIWNDQRFWRGKRRYNSDPVADLVKQKVDLLVNISASPWAVGKPQLRESMLAHSAVAHDLPVIYANQVGANDDLIFDGHSLAFDRRGQVVSKCLGFQSDLLILKYDLERRDLRADNSAMVLSKPFLPKNDHSLIFPKFIPSHQETSSTAEIWCALVLGVQDYATKCGFTKAVLGLSGGIDSALVAAIATAALGSANVLGVLMPSPFNSDHSISDAQELAKNLGILTETIPITPIMSAFDQALATVFWEQKNDITEENLQSRIRGNLLMAIANKFGHLLLSTGNKSEMSVGYCTLYGDMNGGLAVISDVYKTQVYALCAWLNLEQKVIPPQILTKAPSAELKPDQLDQDSLPAYEILDEILEKLISERQSIAQIIAAGADAEVVNRVAFLVNRAEFKRRQAPPGLKISNRAFGSGWRMPIAAKRSSLNSEIL